MKTQGSGHSKNSSSSGSNISVTLDPLDALTDPLEDPIEMSPSPNAANSFENDNAASAPAHPLSPSAHAARKVEIVVPSAASAAAPGAPQTVPLSLPSAVPNPPVTTAPTGPVQSVVAPYPHQHGHLPPAPSPLASPVLSSTAPSQAINQAPPRHSSHTQPMHRTHAPQSMPIPSPINSSGPPHPNANNSSFHNATKQGSLPSGEPPTKSRRGASIHWENEGSAAHPSPAATSATSPDSYSKTVPDTYMEPVHFSPRSSAAGSPTMYEIRPASSGSLTSHQSYHSFGDVSHGSDSVYTNQSVGNSENTPPISAAASSESIGGKHTSKASSATTSSARNETTKTKTTSTKDKRQKRLERNRESARLSRRRRKQYLEDLEVRVNAMSEEMDRGRLNHASMAFKTIKAMRLAKLMEAERILFGGGFGNIKITQQRSAGLQRGFSAQQSQNLQNSIRQIETNFSRTNNEYQIIALFHKEQLKGLVQPMATKFVLWLSLQKDPFFRGGRAASERLSAARIGEKLLHSGTYRASPSDGMWPLVCNEVGLSYEQEDKIRQCQRTVLSDNNTWISRHTALATRNVLESVQGAISGVHETVKRRESAILSVLTVEQRIAFLAWAARRTAAIRRVAEPILGSPQDELGGLKVSPERHVAANMYITDYQLLNIKRRLLPAPMFVAPANMKKLSRRPSFESLAGHQEPESGSKLNREASFPSTGSLKRSLDQVANEESGDRAALHHTPANGVTPESAQQSSAAAVSAALKDVMHIIPKSTFGYSQRRNFMHYPRMAHPPIQHSTMPLQQPKPMHRAPPPKVVQPQPQVVFSQARSQLEQTSSPTLDSVDDIPMPTPVSVLMRTSDEFVSLQPMPSAETPVPAPHTVPSPFVPNPFIPNPVMSIKQEPTPYAAISNTGPYQPAPQPPSEPSGATYPSLLPASMAMIPVPEEGSLVNNPLQINDDFLLDDLPMDADDWAIGEGFDMEINDSTSRRL